MAGLGTIDHFVVLMLENRSFDNLLGKLYPKSAGFHGLSGEESNPDVHGQLLQVWTTGVPVPAGSMTMPSRLLKFPRIPPRSW